MACQNSGATCDACGRTVCPRCGRCYERVPQRYGGWKRQCPSRFCRQVKFLHGVLFR